MSKLKNLIGQTFGRLTVVARANNTKGGQAQWKCICSCREHNEVIVSGIKLRRGDKRSCGCLRKEVVSKTHKVHGLGGTRLYDVWNSMKQRCYNSNCQDYADYGGRGIAVCAEWLGKNGFIHFYNWSMANGYDENAPKRQCTVERIDTNGNYEPSNCKFATQNEQQNNRRDNHKITHNGKTQNITQWAKELQINKQTLWNRINRNHWSIKKALETPVRGKN